MTSGLRTSVQEDDQGPSMITGLTLRLPDQVVQAGLARALDLEPMQLDRLARTDACSTQQ
ncbi:hypothetical protein [Microlunatus parietis]|uniref:Uncharacterized protein n=1 Tax=Microlunatus parietis TaxID=682979 RepID=A0A7Y9LDL7_9ACTN|nr:hypothetical protein [Microlunatus parietis]NYE73003.1 hypothetical protein [Microlunatus parietis]